MRNDAATLKTITERGDILTLTFADGKRFQVQLLNLFPGVVEKPFIINQKEGTVSLPIAIPMKTIRLYVDPPKKEKSKNKTVTETAPDLQVGRRFRVLREKMGLSGREVSALTGLSASTLSAFEHGRFEARVNTIGKYLSAIGATWEDFLNVQLPGNEKK